MRRFTPVLLLALAPLPARAADEWVGQTVFPVADRLALRDEDGKSIGTLSFNGVVTREFDEWVEVRHVTHPGPYVGRVKKTEVVKLADAEKFFSGKIKADAKDTWAYRNRANARVLNRDFAGAIDDLTEAIRLNPDSSLYIERGRAYRAKGDLDEAIKDYDEALKLDPGYSVALNNRGVVWEAKGRVDRAIEDYTAAIKADPKYSTPYRNRALAYQRRGEFAPAAKDFGEAVRLDPTNATAIDDLAWLLATCPDAAVRDGKRAVALAKKACELTDWRQTLLVETLAAAHAEAGDYEKAVETQKKVLDDAEYMKKYGADVRSKLKLYEAGKPYRTTPPKGAAAKPPTTGKATQPRSEQK